MSPSFTGFRFARAIDLARGGVPTTDLRGFVRHGEGTADRSFSALRRFFVAVFLSSCAFCIEILWTGYGALINP